MITLARFLSVLGLIAVAAAMQRNLSDSPVPESQRVIDIIEKCKTQSVKMLLATLDEKDPAKIEQLLNAKWVPSVEVFRDLFFALDATSDNEWRFALERAANNCIGSTKKQIQLATPCLEALRADSNLRVRAIAAYFVDFMIPYDFTDDQNCERMRFTNSDQESLRWLVIRHLSCSRRYYLIEASPKILFRIANKTPRMVVPCLVEHLQGDSSEAVQLMSLEGLWWYYSMEQIKGGEFREILQRVPTNQSQQLLDLRSSYESKLRSYEAERAED